MVWMKIILHYSLKLRKPLLLRSSSSLAGDALAGASKREEVTRPKRTLSSIFANPKRNPLPESSSKPKIPSSINVKLARSSMPPRRSRPFQERVSQKALSPEAAMLVSRLQDGGYLKDANFSRGAAMEPHQIPANLYSHHFLKSAAEKFGQDHQVIAKWLSGSDLKKVALFGCPSVERKTVFAAKRLRAFFNIQEDIICRGCKVKTWCKFTNQKVEGQDKVILADVMRAITPLTLNTVPPQLLPLPGELKLSVGKLLKEVVCLSK